MKVAIILFNRRGGMVHYTSQLSNALAKNISVTALASSKTRKYFSDEVNFINLSLPPNHLHPKMLILSFFKIRRKVIKEGWISGE